MVILAAKKNYLSSGKIKIEKWSQKNKKSENGHFGRKKKLLVACIQTVSQTEK